MPRQVGTYKQTVEYIIDRIGLHQDDSYFLSRDIQQMVDDLTKEEYKDYLEYIA